MRLLQDVMDEGGAEAAAASRQAYQTLLQTPKVRSEGGRDRGRDRGRGIKGRIKGVLGLVCGCGGLIAISPLLPFFLAPPLLLLPSFLSTQTDRSHFQEQQLQLKRGLSLTLPLPSWGSKSPDSGVASINTAALGLS